MSIPNPTTRLSLIWRLSDRADQEAWYEFVEIYEPLIFNIASKSGAQHSDAREITQEVLARVLSSIESRDHANASGSFRGWLYRITRNLTIDFIRKNKRHTVGRVPADLEQIGQPSSHDSNDFYMEYERQLFKWASEKAKAAVTEKNWQAFWLSTMGGVPIPQVARRLGVSPGAVHVARSRIMSRITRLIQVRLSESSSGGE